MPATQTTKTEYAQSTSPTIEPRCISSALRKGGTGKTMLSINVADRLAARARERNDDARVLLVDGDPEGNASEGVGLADAYTTGPHVGQLLEDNEDVQVNDVIRETAVPGLDCIPAHEDLGRSCRVVDDTDQFAVLCLEEKIVEPLLGDRYEYIMIDTPPSAEMLLSDAAMVASGNLIIPMEPSEESVRGFEQMMGRQIEPLRKHRDVSILALVPNKCRPDNETSRMLDSLEEFFPQYLPSFARGEARTGSPGPGIRHRVDIKRAWRAGVPLSMYEPESDMIERFDELAAIIEQGGIE